MQAMIAVALGGALGAVMRYSITLLSADIQTKIPYAILFCNVLGSLLMGLLLVVMFEKQQLNPELKPLLMIGLLGGFTTFSTFSWETFNLMQSGQIVWALLYVALSVCLSITALAIGVWLARLL